MEERIIKSRVQHKIGTYEDWKSTKDFSPLKGELIVYTPNNKVIDDTRPIKIKIGDGTTLVEDLPFVETVSTDNEGGNHMIQQIQSNWNQSDSTQVDYIKNKPFYSQGGFNYEWNGNDNIFNTSFNVAGTFDFYLISQDIPQDLGGARVKSYFDGSPVNEVIGANVVLLESALGNSFGLCNETFPVFAIIKHTGSDEAMGISFDIPDKTGIYFMRGNDNEYTSSLIKDEIIQQIDKKFIPNLENYISQSEKNITIPTLDQNGKIPISQIPATGAGGIQVQTDWNQNDDSQVDYLRNKPFSSKEITYEFNMPRLCNTIKWDGNITDKKEITQLSGPTNFMESYEHYYKVSDEVITYDDILWGHITANSSLLNNLPISDMAKMAKDWSVGITLTDIVLDPITIVNNPYIFSTKFLVSTALSGTLSLEIEGSEFSFNVPEPGTYFYYSQTDEDYFYVNSMTGDIDYSQINIDVEYESPDETAFSYYQKVNTNYLKIEEFLEGLQYLDCYMEDHGSEQYFENFSKITFGENLVKSLLDQGGYMEENDGSWWVPNLFANNAYLPIIVSIKSPNTIIGDIEFIEPGLYFSYQGEFDVDNETWFISYITKCYKDIVVSMEKKFLPSDNTEIIFGSILCSDEGMFGYNGIVLNMGKYMAEYLNGEISLDTPIVNYPYLNNPQEIYIFPEGMLNVEGGFSGGGIIGIADEIITPPNFNIEEMNLNSLSIKCKYKILLIGAFENKPSSVLRCIRLSSYDNLYLGQEMELVGGGAINVTDNVTQNSTDPISSGGIWTALGGRQKLEFDNSPQQGSSKLITSGDIYNILGNYKFRVSDKIPTAADGVDNYTITFVI